MTKLRWLTEKKHWLRPTLNPIAHYCKKIKIYKLLFSRNSSSNDRKIWQNYGKA